MTNNDSPRSYASLCLYGEDLDPDEVSRTLGIEPTSSGRRGGPLRRGRVLSRGFWCVSTRDDCDSDDASEHVARLASMLGMDPPAIVAAVGRYEARVYIYWDLQDGNGGPVLTPPALAWLAQVGAELHVDLYESEAP